MNTPFPEVDLDSSPSKIKLEAETNFVKLRVSVTRWKTLASTLCDLRADGVGFLLHILPVDVETDEGWGDDELEAFFRFLHDWGQLSVANMLAVCGDWIPNHYRDALKQESVTELKWLEQWQMAANDRRFVKYPALPWRRFLRTVNRENLEFILRFLSLSASVANDANREAMETLLKGFLHQKKNPVSIFPKTWNKAGKRSEPACRPV